MIATLRQRNFALLWTAGFFTILANWALYTVLPVYLFQETGSVLVSGLVLAVIAVPRIVIGPFAGVFVDRWDRRRVMLWVNMAQAGSLLGFAALSQQSAIWPAYAVIIVQATLATFYSPAETALLPTVVADEQLISANALNSLNDNLARILGPMVGTLMFARFGLGAVALFNAGVFLLAALLVWLVRVSPPQTHAAAAGTSAEIDLGEVERGIWRELRAGVRVVWQSRLLRSVFLVLALMTLADAPLSAMLAPWVDGTLGAGAAGFGTLMSVRGVAGILGGVAVAQFGMSIRADRLLGFGCLVLGIGVVAMAIVQSFLVACIGMVVLGPAIAAIQTGAITLLQRGSGDRVRGRVFSLLSTMSGAVTLVSTVLGSILGEAASPQIVIGLAGLIYSAAGVVGFVILASPAAGVLPSPAESG